ncbi:MAG: hypothetical protein ACSHX0_10285 [Akkermansiaceae bacterium]
MNRISEFQKRALTSVLIAVGVHLFAVVTWVSIVALDVPVFRKTVLEIPKEEESEVTITLQVIETVPEESAIEVPAPESQELESPEPEVAEVPEPPAEKNVPTPPVQLPEPPDEEKARRLAEQKQKFARTSREQEGTPDAPTDLLGERDTRAASELPAVAGAPENTASQNGVAPLHPNHIETVERTYEDGSLGEDSRGEETQLPQEATAGGEELDKPKEEVEGEVAETVPEFLKLDLDPNQVIEVLNKRISNNAIQSREEPTSEEKEKLKDEPVPNQEKNQIADFEGKGSAKNQELKKDGFSGYSSKTRMAGSITRNGKSALNVKNSPIGRYQALVSKAVESQWRRSCEKHRDHIVPGIMSLRFYVDKDGQVSGIKFQEIIEGNYIERGFTQRAIRNANLPPMPADAVRELNGDPLELVYNFYF